MEPKLNEAFPACPECGSSFLHAIGMGEYNGWKCEDCKHEFPETYTHTLAQSHGFVCLKCNGTGWISNLDPEDPDKVHRKICDCSAGEALKEAAEKACRKPPTPYVKHSAHKLSSKPSTSAADPERRVEWVHRSSANNKAFMVTLGWRKSIHQPITKLSSDLMHIRNLLADGHVEFRPDDEEFVFLVKHQRLGTLLETLYQQFEGFGTVRVTVERVWAHGLAPVNEGEKMTFFEGLES